MTDKEIELYKLEIEELTELLKTEWLDLRETLKNAEFEVENILLIAYCEDDNNGEHGILFTKEKRVIEFEIHDTKLSLKDISDNENLKSEIPQVAVVMDFF